MLLRTFNGDVCCLFFGNYKILKLSDSIGAFGTFKMLLLGTFNGVWINESLINF